MLLPTLTNIKPHLFREKQFRRSTTGCLACRQRRKKCNESKPICKGCLQNKLLCIYDEEHNRKKLLQLQKLSTGAKVRVSANVSSPEVHGYVRYYLQHVTPELVYTSMAPSKTTGLTEIWRELIPQLAQHYSCVEASLEAMALNHEAFERRCARPNAMSAGDSIGHKLLAKYNKALRALQIAVNESRQQGALPILVSCLLLFLTECVRGSMTTAVVHLKGATGLIRVFQEGKFGTSEVDQSLVLIIQRLRLTAGGYFFGEYTDEENYGMTPLESTQQFPRRFKTYSEVVLSQLFLFSRIRGAVFENILVEVPLKPALQETLVEDLRSWRLAYLGFLAPQDSQDRKDSRMLEAQIGVYYTFMRLFLCSSGLGLSEGLKNTPSVFRDALSACRALVEAREDRESPPARAFTMLSGLVPCLWFVAARSFDRDIRVAAIDLLRRAAVRECFWDSELAAQVAQRLDERQVGGTCVPLQESFRGLGSLINETGGTNDCELSVETGK